VRELTARGESLAIETTLASRTFAPLFRDVTPRGYQIHLVYYWLADPEDAIRRVAERVRLGGHHIPAEIIRRRYFRGLRNFFSLYRPIVHTWRVYDNSGERPVLVATKLLDQDERIPLPDTWLTMQRLAERGDE
jgi:predicted ABC-type ATPase